MINCKSLDKIGRDEFEFLNTFALDKYNGRNTTIRKKFLRNLMARNMRLSTLVGYRKNWPCCTTHLYMFRLILAFTMRSRGWRISSFLSFGFFGSFVSFLLRRISNGPSWKHFVTTKVVFNSKIYRKSFKDKY